MEVQISTKKGPEHCSGPFFCTVLYFLADFKKKLDLPPTLFFPTPGQLNA